MDIAWLLCGILAVFAAAGVGYELGRDNGLAEGERIVYDSWARRIEYGGVEQDYLEEIVGNGTLPQVDIPKRRKIKLKKKHRKKNESKYDKLVWFFGDVVKIKKPTKWNKCNVNKMIKDLEAELRAKGELDESI